MSEFQETETRIVEMVFPNHTNSNDQLFGGYALSLMAAVFIPLAAVLFVAARRPYQRRLAAIGAA